MEDEPTMRIELPDGEEFEATRDNSSLFRFMGRLAIYDHGFFVTSADENRGFYIFKNNANFETLAEYMLKNEFQAHLNLRQVADCDLEAYNRMLHKEAEADLDGGVPDDWL